jgi:hypothetical protein
MTHDISMRRPDGVRSQQPIGIVAGRIVVLGAGQAVVGDRRNITLGSHELCVIVVRPGVEDQFDELY